MITLKNDPKTALPASPSPATKPGADLNTDLSTLSLPNSVERGVDRMLEGPAAFQGLHSAESVAKKFGRCTIGSVTMTVEIGEKV